MCNSQQAINRLEKRTVVNDSANILILQQFTTLGEHTWIRSVEDIKTFAEANEDFAGTPDYTEKDMREAMKKGSIKVYSSYPIKDGAFVTPSLMEAQDYAGGGKVYEKTLKVDNIAWIDSLQGQVASIEGDGEKFSNRVIDAREPGRDKDGFLEFDTNEQRVKYVNSRYDEGVDFEYGDAGKVMRVHRGMNSVNNLHSINIETPAQSKQEAHEGYAKLKYATSKDTGERVEFFNTMFGKNHREGGLFEKVAPSLDKIFEDSILIYSEADNNGGEIRPDKSVHKSHDYGFGNYLGRITMNGKEYYVRLTVQRQKNRPAIHSTFVTNVEVYENPSNIVPGLPLTQEGVLDVERISDAKLKQYFEFAKENPEKINIHSHNFKDWFGDWEKDPENASKVVDEEGKPLVVYHGTNQYGFTVFDPLKSDDGRSLFFTNKLPTAKTYSGVGGVRKLSDTVSNEEAIEEASSRLYEKISNMLSMVTREYPWALDTWYERERIMKLAEDVVEGRIDLFDAEDDIYDHITDAIAEHWENDGEYEDFAEWQDNSQWYEDAMTELLKITPAIEGYKNAIANGYDLGNYAVYLNLKNPLVIDAKGASWKHIKVDGLPDERSGGVKTRTISKYAKENGYDGVVIKNVYDEGDNAEHSGESSDVYIAFEPTQIKSATDNNGGFAPNNPDIRYSNRSKKLASESDDEVFSKALNEFGETKDWKETGWLMPDGKQLNFAEKEMPGQRDRDHREIGVAYANTEDTRWKYLQDFEQRGGIRISEGRYNGIELSVKPTSEQMQKLAEFVRLGKGVVDIDFMDENYNVAHTASYDNVKPQRVVADIRKYYDEGLKPEGNAKFSHRKEEQLDIILKNNPADDSLGAHTWIRGVEDIKTFAEANEDFAGTPDYTEKDMREAMRKGGIKVYSSYPIKDGAFVTPSLMEAQNYAGGGKVYEKTLKVDNIAWIDSLQGQVASIEGDGVKFSIRNGDYDHIFTPDHEEFREAWEYVKNNNGLVRDGLEELEFKITPLGDADVKSKKYTADVVSQKAKELQGKLYWRDDRSQEVSVGHDSITKFQNNIRRMYNKLTEAENETAKNKIWREINAYVALLDKFKEVFNTSELVETHLDYPKAETVEGEEPVRDSGLTPNQDSLMHRLYSAVEKDGDVFAVKFTVKETIDKGSNNPLHSYEVTEIELSNDTDIQTDSNKAEVPGTQRVNNDNSITGAKLLKGFEKKYDKGVKLVKDSEESKFSVRSGSYFSGGGLVEDAMRGLMDGKFGVEFDSDIAAVFKDNHGSHIINADVRDPKVKEQIRKQLGDKTLEYFHASPVCKNYSKAKRDGEESELDIETAKATADFINEFQPNVVTIENAASYGKSEAVKHIIEALQKNGYAVDAEVYNAKDFGGYINRERLIVRAARDGNIPDVAEYSKSEGWYKAVEDLIPTLKKTELAPWQAKRLEEEVVVNASAKILARRPLVGDAFIAEKEFLSNPQ